MFSNILLFNGGARCLSLFSRFLCKVDTTKSRKIETLNPNPEKMSKEKSSARFIAKVNISGTDILKDASIFKGLGFSKEERIRLGIDGLLPPCCCSQEQQVELCLKKFNNINLDLDKYAYLMELSSINEKLYLRLVCENITQMLPYIYTPTVGDACYKFGQLYMKPRGMYISIRDKGRIADMLKNWPAKKVKVIVVTDGERILGLGDLGVYGMGIPIGKLGLNAILAKIKPSYCMPITLDCGTNTNRLIEDPFYFGLKAPRVRGKEYDDFIDEFMQACINQFGRSCLIQFEDFGNLNAFRLLDKYMGCYTTFNDDIQGTAAITLAGIMAAMRISKIEKVSQNTFVFFGAGEAGLGIADLIVRAMQEEGLSDVQAREKIWFIDSKGLIVKDRKTGGVTAVKAPYAKTGESMDLLSTIKKVKPTILIGSSTIKGSFTPDVLKAMAAGTKVPLIFALSNPTTKCECTAEEAYTNTDGKCVFATGSPFPPVKYKDNVYHTSQANNAYIFPGLSLGITAAGMKCVPSESFAICADIVSKMVTEEDLKVRQVYPAWSDIHNISLNIAIAIVEFAYANDIATVMPKPTNIKEFIQQEQFDYMY